MPVIAYRPFIYLLSAFSLLAVSALVQAAPHSVLLRDDFYPNCDIRQLNLSQEQQNALRRIRIDYKQAGERAYRKAARVDRTRRQSIVRVLSAENFDQNKARDYVENRYLASMDFAVDELAIQHRFFQLLNNTQRQQWLTNCLR
ncbi:Spy/CpxP family protein refolding chaperone [Bergeriella denitrificans]|uniref:Periplasmic protein n=1 Tax=Bergeriella denitrificans TaxID=494 RepID=A0A378UHD1_BERDE|nr:Spy/CpxP family protein refolding chaperone [Bergeriella denitrificans]STZ75911.1 Periplasmic protein [Bergeriella denitrificans]